MLERLRSAVHSSRLGASKASMDGMREAALPPGVQAAAIEAFAAVVLPLAHGEVEVFPVLRGLVGLHAGAADFGNEQAGDGEGVVAHEFGIEAEGALAGALAVVGICGGEFLRGGAEVCW
jgi:hypothetical protein